MRKGGVIVAVALLASGCASTKIGMYDGERSCTDDGGATVRQCDIGAVAVLDPETEEDVGMIDRSDTRSKVNKRGAKVRDTTRENLNARYYDAISSMPEPAQAFTLYFKFDSDDLVEGSDATINSIFKAYKTRPAAEIQIVGHTDTAGDPEGNKGNDVLSAQRAQVVKTILERRGLPTDAASVVGRGEREPIDEPQRDNFPSAKNRRVEVVVR